MLNRAAKKIYSIVLCVVAVGLTGCHEERTKDKVFVSELKRIGATLHPEQSAKVPVPALGEQEVLIVINGSYAVDGVIEPSQYISKELAARGINYAGREGPNYIIYAREQEILSDVGVLDENFRSSTEAPPYIAKIAHVGTRYADVRCVPREAEVSVSVWNPHCRIELTAFE